MKKNKIIFILLSLIYISLFTDNLLAVHKEIDGWDWLEKQATVELWQRKSSSIISEVIINNQASLKNEISRGYSIRFIDEEDIPNFYFYDYPLSIWKIYYHGVDSNGNIYLKMHTLKDGISEGEILKLMGAIEEISQENGEEHESNMEDILKNRLAFFNDQLDDYLEEEGEIIIVDSSKAVVINNIEEIPAFNFTINEAHSVLNIRIGLNG
ncbi:MAG: hypothetical protein ACOC4G_09400 [Bacillota bacterium]